MFFATSALLSIANIAYIRILYCHAFSQSTIFLAHGYQMSNSWIACLGICSFPRTPCPYPVLFTSTQKSYSLYLSQLLGTAVKSSGLNYICGQLHKTNSLVFHIKTPLSVFWHVIEQTIPKGTEISYSLLDDLCSVDLRLRISTAEHMDWVRGITGTLRERFPVPLPVLTSSFMMISCDDWCFWLKDPVRRI